jgi:hypothetical protein
MIISFSCAKTEHYENRKKPIFRIKINLFDQDVQPLKRGQTLDPL